MRIESAPEVATWLASEPVEFDWDRGNMGKSERKHGISDETVEAVLSNPYLFLGRVVEPAHSEGRYIALGDAGEGGRGYALVFGIRAGKVRPISCRSMRDGERRLYEEALGT